MALDGVVAVLVIYNCFLVPYEVCGPSLAGCRGGHARSRHSCAAVLGCQRSTPGRPAVRPGLCCATQIGFSTPAPHVINNLEWGVDAFFAVDICCNFRTAYVDSTATLVRDGGAVATHYLKTWFGVDLMATIPFEAIVS